MSVNENVNDGSKRSTKSDAPSSDSMRSSSSETATTRAERAAAHKPTWSSTRTTDLDSAQPRKTSSAASKPVLTNTPPWFARLYQQCLAEP